MNSKQRDLFSHERGKFKDRSLAEKLVQIAFKGTISYQTLLSEVLKRILKKGRKGMISIQLTDPTRERQGNIYISHSKFICGADLRVPPYTTSTSISRKGYEALKVLCTMASAEYKVITGPPTYFEDADVSLNVRISSIISLIPKLPDELELLTDQDKLLNRVFSGTENLGLIEPALVTKEGISLPMPAAQDWTPLEQSDVITTPPQANKMSDAVAKLAKELSKPATQAPAPPNQSFKVGAAAAPKAVPATEPSKPAPAQPAAPATETTVLGPFRDIQPESLAPAAELSVPTESEHADSKSDSLVSKSTEQKEPLPPKAPILTVVSKPSTGDEGSKSKPPLLTEVLKSRTPTVDDLPIAGPPRAFKVPKSLEVVVNNVVDTGGSKASESVAVTPEDLSKAASSVTSAAPKQAPEAQPPPTNDGWHPVKDIDICVPIEGNEPREPESKFISLQDRAKDEFKSSTLEQPKARSRNPILSAVISFVKSPFVNTYSACAHILRNTPKPVLIIIVIAIAMAFSGKLPFPKLRLPNSPPISIPSVGSAPTTPAAPNVMPRTPEHFGRRQHVSPPGHITTSSRSGGDAKTTAVTAPTPVRLPKPDYYVLNKDAPVQHRRAYQTAP